MADILAFLPGYLLLKTSCSDSVRESKLTEPGSALIISGITLSLTRSVEQDSVLSGIVYGGYVVFPEDNLAHSSLSLPTLPTVISSLWLNNNTAVGIMNYLLTLTGFLIFLYAYFLILRSFLNPHPQLILVALVLTIWNPVYDYFSTSYPAVLPGTTTTFGLFGIGLAFLTFSKSTDYLFKPI